MDKLNKRNKNIAMRPDAIIEARFSLTPKQNDLLDMLLCEISDDDNYKYVISVDKYKSIYQNDTSNLYRDLKKAAKSFEGKGFRIINKKTREEIYYSWFSKIHYMPKNASVIVNIDLDFKKLLIEVKKFIKYDISYTLNFNSQYSQRIYYYLKSFEDTGWRIDSIEELQHKLECPKSYKNFADFKRAVLDISQNEINSKSDIIFSYDAKKTGRKVTHLKFTIKSKNKITEITDNNTQLIPQVRQFITESLTDNEVLSLLKAANNNVNLIKEKYELMHRQKYVDNIIGWLISALQKDYKENSRNSYYKVDSFNNYPQRDYNFSELERKLLGQSTPENCQEQIAMELDD